MAQAPKPLRIKGPAGELECLWLPPRLHPNMAAVICHPLPTAGGTMHNKVVYTMNQVFAAHGMGVMRFNTRGTGTSDGRYDNGVGEIEDLASVIDHLLDSGISQLWLAGFSFGSFLAFNLTTVRPEVIPHIEHLVMVGPPVARFDYHISSPLPFPVTILQGEKDEVVDPASVFAWAKQISMWIPGFTLLRFAGCSHFFHGQLLQLRERLNRQLCLDHPQLFGKE